MVGTRKEFIERALQALEPTFLEVLNESDNHAGPPGRESHFRVRVVSSAFEGENRVKRHRRVNALLKDIMGDGGVHAMALELYTPQQWAERQGVGVESPDCQGARKEPLRG